MVHGLIVKMNHPEFLFPFLSSLDQEDFFHSNLDGNQIGAAHYNDGRIYLQKSPFNRENFILDEFAQENIESSVYLLGTEFRPQGRSFQSPKAQPFSYKTWTAYFDIDNRDKIESQLIPPLMAKLPVENFVKSNCASKKAEEVILPYF